ncbi:MAG: hypothetical protein H0W75_03175 [Chitinophagaceae bacterium]|nr:hypothetical protein [Chitinophagaceae bacterium]
MNSTNIEEIGYKQKDDQDYDWLEQEEKSDETEHIIIRFESNDYIRIFCEYIEVKIEIS